MGVEYSKPLAEQVLREYALSSNGSISLDTREAQECFRSLLRDLTSGKASVPEPLRLTVRNYFEFKPYPIIFAEHINEVETWILEPILIERYIPDGRNLPDRLFKGIFLDGQATRRICSLQFLRLRADFNKRVMFGRDANAIVSFLEGDRKKNASDCDDLDRAGDQLQALYDAHPGLLLVTAFSSEGDDCLEDSLPSDELRLDDVVKEIERQKWSEIYRRGSISVFEYLDGICEEFLTAEESKINMVSVIKRRRLEKSRQSRRQRWKNRRMRQASEVSEAKPNLDIQSLYDMRGNSTSLKPHQKRDRQRQMSCSSSLTMSSTHGSPTSDAQAPGDTIPPLGGYKNFNTTVMHTSTVPETWDPDQVWVSMASYPMPFQMDPKIHGLSHNTSDSPILSDVSGLTYHVGAVGEPVAGHAASDKIPNPTFQRSDQNPALKPVQLPSFSSVCNIAFSNQHQIGTDLI